MIRTEHYINEHDGVEFIRTWSDSNRYVCREGQQWTEANDPAEFNRTYTEGDIIAEEDSSSLSAEAALSIITGGEI